MWPKADGEEEEEVKAQDITLPPLASLPVPTPSSSLTKPLPRMSSMSSKSTGATRREQANAIKKKKEEEKRLKEEETKRKKKLDAKKRREKAKKATGKKKKHKKVWKPDEIEVGDVVLVAKGIAVTRWKGVLHFRKHDGLWLGVEFVDGPFGKNNGKVQGKRYFKTKKKNHGAFVKQITRKLKPEDLLSKLGTVQSQLKSRQDALEASHKAIVEYKQKEAKKASQNPELANLKTPMSKLNLLDQVSESLEQYALETPETHYDVMLNMEDDSSSEEYLSDSDDDEPFNEEEYQRRKGERKNLLLASQTDLYREGSLRKMHTQMQEHMNKLKTQHQDSPTLVKQSTLSSMGLVLPEKNASPEEVAVWIRQNLSKAPGHPDMEDEKIMEALTWTLGLFLKVQDNFSF